MGDDRKVLGPKEFARWCTDVATKEANDVIEIRFRAIRWYASFLSSIVSGFLAVGLVTGAITGNWHNLQVGGLLVLAYVGVLGPILWIMRKTEAEVLIEHLPRKVTMSPEKTVHGSTDLH